MALRKYGKYWYIYYRDPYGVIRTRSTRMTSRSEAEKIEQIVKIKNELDRQRYRSAKNTFPSMADAMRHSAVTSVRTQNALRLEQMPRIAEKYRNLSDDHRKSWQHFVENVGVKNARDVTPAIALAYLDKHFGHMTAKTWNNHRGQLSTVFRACLVEAKLDKSPFDSIAFRSARPGEIKGHRPLSDEEIALIMEKGTDTIRLMTMLARWTGQRLETCARITFDQIDFEKKVFLMKPAKTARFNKFIVVPIFPALEQYLRSIEPKIKDKKNPIVENFHWTKKDTFSSQYGEYLRRIGIQSTAAGTASFHSLRSSFVTWAKQAGLTADTRQAITGHSTATIEDIYANNLNLVCESVKNL